MKDKLAILLAISPAVCVLIGLVVGALRYKKHGEEVRKRVTEDYKEKRARGGINELLFKRPDKRIAFETFGIPIIISFVAGIILMLILFKIY